jgi:hypothetical protein
MAFKIRSYETYVPSDASATVADISGEFAGTYQLHVQNAGPSVCYIATETGPYTLQPGQQISFPVSGDVTFDARTYNSPLTSLTTDTTLVQVLATGESA